MKLSIITINRNNAEGLEKTLASAACQTFKNFEHIVIDGASSDGSVEVIKKFPHIAYWVSEPDGGIYYAMNKGTEIAKGEYCLYLNSGDYLANENVLRDIFELNYTQDIIYGNTIIESKSGKNFLYKTFKESDFSLLLMIKFGNFVHQSMLIKKSLLLKCNMYNINYKFYADYSFNVLALFKYGCSYKHHPKVISVYQATGLSSVPETRKFRRPELDKLYMELFNNDVLYKEMERLSHYGNILMIPGVKPLCRIFNFYERIKFSICSFFGKTMDSALGELKDDSVKYSTKVSLPFFFSKKKDVYLWGAGVHSTNIMFHLYLRNIVPDALIDSKAEENSLMYNLPVLPPKNILQKEKGKFFILISTPVYALEIKHTLLNAGFKEGRDFAIPFLKV